MLDLEIQVPKAKSPKVPSPIISSLFSTLTSSPNMLSLQSPSPGAALLLCPRLVLLPERAILSFQPLPGTNAGAAKGTAPGPHAPGCWTYR